MFEKLKFQRLHEAQMKIEAQSFYRKMQTRRTVRDFSDQPVPGPVIRDALLCAGTAPSGANMQPWHFAVTTDLDVKERIKMLQKLKKSPFTAGVHPQHG